MIEPDWNQLWQQARRAKSWKSKKKADWDQRATAFRKRNADSAFAKLFIKKMRPQAHWSVLDVGCGPGTLAIPLAPQVARITALDFSQAMLNQLTQRQQRHHISTITPVQASWQDDWQQLAIPPHDVCLAARSLAVDDLRAALEKLCAWATKKVFIADRVGAGPFDPDLFAALGRPFEPGPDFIYTVNILFQMGIHPHLDYLEFDQQRSFATRADARQGWSWMIDKIQPDEEMALDTYLDERLTTNEDGTVTFTRRQPARWAFISWDM